MFLSGFSSAELFHSGSGDILMDIILLGIGVGFGLYIVVSLLGYSIRAMIKLFK